MSHSSERSTSFSQNLQITLTPFKNQSRILRETSSLVERGVTQRVSIAALHEDGLKEWESIDEQRSVWRVRLRSRGWPRTLPMQLLKYAEFSWRISWYARRIRPDLVNVHSLALLPLGVWLKIWLRARLVYDTHELETERNGLSGLRQALSRFIERRFIRYVDLVVVVSECIREHYVAAYGHPAVVTMLNCPPCSRVSRSDLLREELQIPASAKIFLYHGNLAPGRGIPAMLDAFRGANPNERALVVMGYGHFAAQVQAEAERSRAIYFRDAVAPGDVVRYAASADVGLCLIEDICLSYRYCLPNKLFEFLMAGLPVIVSNLPEMASLVRDYRVGEIAYEVSADGIEDPVRRLLAADPEGLAANVRQAARRFSWETEEAQIIESYREHVLNPPRPGGMAKAR